MADNRSPAGPESTVLVSWVALAGVAIVAAMLRSLPWKNFLGRTGEYLFYGPDSYDHLRRITLGLTTFPTVPSFDSYYGYPIGTGQIWSPLFDYLLSLLTLLCGGTAAHPEVAETIGFWLSPALTAVTLVLLYRMMQRVAGRNAALVAALVLALLPGHILYSFAAELDHHVAEPVVCLGLLAALLVANEHLGGSRSGWLIALPVALWMLLAILIWRGSVIFWGVAEAALLLQCGSAAYFGRSLRPLAQCARDTNLLAGAMLVPICLFNVWGSAGGMNFGIVSWFHVGLLALAAGFFWLLVHGVWDRRRLMIAAFVVVTGGSLLLLLLPAGRRLVLEALAGLRVIGGRDPWLDSIAELRPMLFPDGALQFWHATETLSLAYWLFPALLVYLARRWWQGRCVDFRSLLVMVWGSFFWLLPLFRERYVHLTAVAIAAGAGIAYAEAVAWGQRSGRRAIVGTTLAGLVACLLPCAPFLWRLPEVGLTAAERYDLPDTLAWLRERTPATSYFTKPLNVPEYGVLAEWGLGAYINYVGHRPTVATNFGWETHGLYESTAFLVQSDPGEAAKILDTNRVRYLMLNDVTGQLPLSRAIAEQGVGRNAVAPLGAFQPLASMYYRLYLQDGSAFALQGTETQALGRYRLVYESAGGSPEPVMGMVSHYKIFEYVPGALLTVTTVPGTMVTVELPLRAGSGRRFTYRDQVMTDGAGQLAVRLPYATTAGTGDVVPLGPYRIKYAAGTVLFTVQPEAVLNGAKLSLIQDARSR